MSDWDALERLAPDVGQNNADQDQLAWFGGGQQDNNWDFDAVGDIGWGALPDDFLGVPPAADNDHDHAHDNLPAQPLPRITHYHQHQRTSPPAHTLPPPPPAPQHDQLPNHLYPLWGTLSDDNDDTPQPRPLSPVSSDSASAEFVTLEDSSDEQDEDAMPAQTRRARVQASRRSSVVDLTSETPPEDTSTRGTKRRRSTDIGEGRAPKRTVKGRRGSDDGIEQLDLTNEAPSADEELLQQQQKAAIKAQQEEQDEGPQKIGQRQCIICMENYTNATATACGHFYCHECLVRAIMAAERNNDRTVGTCPVCRKSISRRKKGDIIPISFMTKSQFAKNQSKRTDLVH